MRRKIRIWKVILYVILGTSLFILLFVFCLDWFFRPKPPKPASTASLTWSRTDVNPDFSLVQNNWLHRSRSGLYELYVEGSPYERGVANGKLCKELLQKQEEYFNEQIGKMVPSKFYLHFLKYFVEWFNRNLDQNVTDEYKKEIFGISASASDQFDYIGTNYQRILNYHAAHDIGHALQNLALVGCTSFGTWDDASADGNMIIGRNFDFYVGDQFAQNKIVDFVNPAQGFKFMSVGWAGFIGVVSGMNEKGLTVTINAAKSQIPTGSATPVSLVAREILQYAENISEAIEIAKKRRMFVSESFLIASAEDHKAVVIQKTPDSLDIYDPHTHSIICANHFQGESLGKLKSNMEQVAESASLYRFQRLQELLALNGKNTVQKTADILRDRGGLHNENIGLGNEKAIDQLIAHHSIIFEPQKLLVWVSTSPWQLGEYVAYDLKKVFAIKNIGQGQEIYEPGLTIAADTFLNSKSFVQFLKFKKYRQVIAAGGSVNPDSLIFSNPEFYQSYQLAGDIEFRKKEFEKATGYYEQALTREIATKKEEEYIRRQITKCKGK
jgi:hypothetical protein